MAVHLPSRAVREAPDLPTPNDWEILALGRGRVESADSVPNDIPDLGVIHLEISNSSTTGTDRRQLTSISGRPWHTRAALTIALGLLIVIGSAVSQAMVGPEPNPPALLAAGHAGLNGPIEDVSPDAAVVPILVSLLGTGTVDVEILSMVVVGWSPSEPDTARAPPVVHAGHWRNITTNLVLDCRAPQPPVPQLVHVHARTAHGDTIEVLSLPRRANDVANAWQAFCSDRPGPEHLRGVLR